MQAQETPACSCSGARGVSGRRWAKQPYLPCRAASHLNDSLAAVSDVPVQNHLCPHGGPWGRVASLQFWECVGPALGPPLRGAAKLGYHTAAAGGHPNTLWAFMRSRKAGGHQ